MAASSTAVIAGLTSISIHQANVIILSRTSLSEILRDSQRFSDSLRVSQSLSESLRVSQSLSVRDQESKDQKLPLTCGIPWGRMPGGSTELREL